MRARRPLLEVAYRPTTFAAGTHSVVLAKAPNSGRWTLAVDGTPSTSTFETEVEAWEAGIRAADLLDREAAAKA